MTISAAAVCVSAAVRYVSRVASHFFCILLSSFFPAALSCAAGLTRSSLGVRCAEWCIAGATNARNPRRHAAAPQPQTRAQSQRRTRGTHNDGDDSDVDARAAADAGAVTATAADDSHSSDADSGDEEKRMNAGAPLARACLALAREREAAKAERCLRDALKARCETRGVSRAVSAAAAAAKKVAATAAADRLFSAVKKATAAARDAADAWTDALEALGVSNKCQSADADAAASDSGDADDDEDDNAIREQTLTAHRKAQRVHATQYLRDAPIACLSAECTPRPWATL